MKNSVFILCVFFLFSCGNNGPKVVAPPANLTGMTVVEYPGTKFQKAIRTDPNGNVMEEGEIYDGKKTGTWVVYRPGTRIMVESVINYLNGLRNGIYMTVNDRNQVETFGYYADDQKDGKWTKYKYTRREWEEEYRNGKLHGIRRTFYNTGKDGVIKEEVEFKNGVQDGIYRYYQEDGTISMDYVYKNGEIVERKSGGN